MRAGGPGLAGEPRRTVDADRAEHGVDQPYIRQVEPFPDQRERHGHRDIGQQEDGPEDHNAAQRLVDEDRGREPQHDRERHVTAVK